MAKTCLVAFSLAYGYSNHIYLIQQDKKQWLSIYFIFIAPGPRHRIPVESHLFRHINALTFILTAGSVIKSYHTVFRVKCFAFLPVFDVKEITLNKLNP